MPWGHLQGFLPKAPHRAVPGEAPCSQAAQRAPFHGESPRGWQPPPRQQPPCGGAAPGGSCGDPRRGGAGTAALRAASPARAGLPFFIIIVMMMIMIIFLFPLGKRTDPKRTFPPGRPGGRRCAPIAPCPGMGIGRGMREGMCGGGGGTVYSWGRCRDRGRGCPGGAAPCLARAPPALGRGSRGGG